ncbi:MAG: hypothetical protein HZB85_03865 [Deltaproteobacteria bacterium]|nr:hypothetical protein [Deltaproteobacteria bacterium]
MIRDYNITWRKAIQRPMEAITVLSFFRANVVRRKLLTTHNISDNG